MPWYTELINRIQREKVFSHKELINELAFIKPKMSDSTYHWAISVLIKEGGLVRLGYDVYCLSDGVEKKPYSPDYSDSALKLMHNLNDKYPHVLYSVFETTLMNDFLNHLIAQNTIFVQVEKEDSKFIFRYLQESGYSHILYRPSMNDFDMYWSKDSIVVSNLISEAPLCKKEPGKIMLKKMLVDMVADKLISTTYSHEELPDIFEQAESRYVLDEVRMLRYARRRNREEEIKKLIKGNVK